MKILSVLGMVGSLILMVAGFVVAQIHCYNPSSYGHNIPDDADMWGYSIMAIGIFFLIFSITTLTRKQLHK